MQTLVMVTRTLAILFPVCLAGCYVLLAFSFTHNALAPPAMVASLVIWLSYAAGLVALGLIGGATPLGAAAWLNLKRMFLWNLFAIPTWFMLVGLVAPLAIMVFTSIFLLEATGDKGVRP
jgi:hypothetical protein